MLHCSRFISCHWIEMEEPSILTLGAYLSLSDTFLLCSWIIPTCVFHPATHFLAFPVMFSQPAPYLPWDKLRKIRQGNEGNIFCQCPWLNYFMMAWRLVLAKLLPQQDTMEGDCKRIWTCCHWWMTSSSWDVVKRWSMPHSISSDLLQEEKFADCLKQWFIISAMSYNYWGGDRV